MNCSRCDIAPPLPPEGTPPAVSIPSQYVFGDVCTVRESISTPVEMVFMDAPGLETKPGARERCAKHYAALTDPSVPPPGKDRPCIILSSSVPVDSASTTICLKTTLGKTPYEQLPLIVKHFGVKVASKQLPAGEEHVHSDPEWPHPQQLILAIAFTTQRPIKGMWPRGRENGLSDTGKPRGEPDSSNATTPLADDGVPVYKYEREARMWLVDKCDELLMKWTQRCQKDPNFAKVVEADFRRCLELAANGSMLSLNSFRSTGRRSTRKFSRPSTPLRKLHEVGNVFSATRPGACSSPSLKSNSRKKSKWSLKSRRSQPSLSQATGDAN